MSQSSTPSVQQQPKPQGESADKPAQHPDGMGAKALEIPVKQMEFEGALGFVKTNPTLRAKLTTGLCEFIEHHLREIGITNQRDLEADVRDFYDLLEDNPAKDAKQGTTGNGLMLWLHLLARQLQPNVIVESGVWVGRSLHTLRSAVPSADVHAFDVSFSKLVERDPSIHYHEYDWSGSDVTCEGVGFCYFDDHINNGRRIREAYDRGFRHLVFDQCAPIGMIYPFRFPGLPSAIMIAEGMLEEGDVLEWMWRGRPVRYEFQKSHTHGAEDLIDMVMPLPAFAPWLGTHAGQSAYVHLKK